jgi:ABC-type polysaccharide/polyol phosphate transport system ATPase subunit
VGDESFQKKSEESLVSLIRSGVTTVFVSHHLEAVKKICTRVLWLHEGGIQMEGAPSKVVREYIRASAK